MKHAKISGDGKCCGGKRSGVKRREMVSSLPLRLWFHRKATRLLNPPVSHCQSLSSPLFEQNCDLSQLFLLCTYQVPEVFKNFLLKCRFTILCSFLLNRKVTELSIYNSFSYAFPLWLSQDTEYSSLCYMEGPCLFILYIIVCLCT